MKFPKAHTLKEIAELIGSEFIGSEDFPVFGMNEIHVVEEGDIVFVDHPKYYDKALESQATVILINKKVALQPKRSDIKVPNGTPDTKATVSPIKTRAIA